MKCGQCNQDMTEGFITDTFGWYTNDQVENKIIFPSSERLFKGVKAKKFSLGYKFYSAERCMGCELVVIRIKNQNT